MNFFWGILLIFIGISGLYYLYKHPIAKEDDITKSMITGIMGGLILIIVGIILLFK